jgi:UDP-N-acetylmuramoyl-tripeptide--D-alanyl-D-alanine ligase
MALRLVELLELWGPPLPPPSPPALATTAPPEGEILRVCSDSRADLRGALFVPLVGERYDGHAFLAEALGDGGVVAAVAQHDRLAPELAERLVRESGKPLWLVEDTLAAYQQLGRLWRRRFAGPVVAVTGSAGKTTTRELIRAVLAPLGPVVASSGNDNNDVGAPLTLLRAEVGTAALVVEMGMRGPGEIERLTRCAEPDVAVITNIGTAHIGRLGSREAIARAKCEIVTSLRPDGLLVIPAGDPLLEATLAIGWSGRVRRVALAEELAGFEPTCAPADRIAHLDAAGTVLTLHRGDGTSLPGGSPAIRLPLPGRHNARNLLLALAVAEELGVPLATLTDLRVDLPGGRSHRLLLGDVEVLDETYNASPEAMMASLELLASRPGRRFAVLGTMLELGESSLDLHRQVAQRAAQLGLDGLVIVDRDAEGVAMEEAAGSLARLVRVPSPQEAAAPLLEWLRPGDRLLLKASRGVALERLIPLLAEHLEQSQETERPERAVSDE